MTLQALEAAGALQGLLGAFMLATARPWAARGWLAFLGSNAAWLAYAWQADLRWLLLQQVGFTATSLLGIWTHLVRPLGYAVRLRRWWWGRVGMPAAGLCLACGARLTPDERTYYETRCEACEGFDLARMVEAFAPPAPRWPRQPDCEGCPGRRHQACCDRIAS